MSKHCKGQNGYIIVTEDCPNSQAKDGEDDAEDGGKDVGNSQRKAQNHA